MVELSKMIRRVHEDPELMRSARKFVAYLENRP